MCDIIFIVNFEKQRAISICILFVYLVITTIRDARFLGNIVWSNQLEQSFIIEKKQTIIIKDTTVSAYKVLRQLIRNYDVITITGFLFHQASFL